MFRKHRDRCQVEPDAIRDVGSDVVPDTQDHLCVFLDRGTKLCAIHEDRPEMCRLFGTKDSPDSICSYVRSNGQPRSRAERRQIQRETTRCMAKLLSMREPRR